MLYEVITKRPDNMPIYAQKTSMSDANMSKEDLVEAITKGGVALQEVLAAQLVSEGQMIRRERSFEGVEVNYIELKEKAKQQADVADKITSVITSYSIHYTKLYDGSFSLLFGFFFQLDVVYFHTFKRTFTLV